MMDTPRTVFEAFGHHPHCGKWKDIGKSIRLQHDIACTCGGEALPDPSAPPPAASCSFCKRTEGPWMGDDDQQQARICGPCAALAAKMLAPPLPAVPPDQQELDRVLSICMSYFMGAGTNYDDAIEALKQLALRASSVSLSPPPMTTTVEHCAWERDGFDDSWDTACGNKFQVMEGTPADNGMVYCCYCGHLIAAPAPEEKP